MTVSTCAVVRSFIESKTTEVQTSNVGFTSEVSDYLVVHTDHVPAADKVTGENNNNTNKTIKDNAFRKKKVISRNISSHSFHVDHYVSV